MFEAAFIVLREAAELLLLGEATLLGLAQAGRPELKQRYCVGTVVGILGGLVLAAWAGSQLADSRLVGVVGLVFLVSVLVLACTFLSSSMRIRQHAFDRLELWVNRSWGRSAVWILAAIIGLRETLEAMVMLAALEQHQSSAMIGAGVLIGLLGVVFIVLLYKSSKERMQLQILFRVSAVLVSLLAVQLLLSQAGSLLLQIFGVDNEPWLDMATPFLPGGEWHLWVFAALIAIPLWVLARSWWWETVER